MLEILHFIAAVLASWRMVELFGQDRITQWIRDRWPSYLWTCHRCLSVWSGIAATALFFTVPWLNWPLALSWLYFWWLFDLLPRKNKHLVLELSRNGRAMIVRSNIPDNLVKEAFIKIAAKL